MDAAQQQPAVFHRRWKKRHTSKTPQAAAAALLLAAAAGLLVRAPNDDTGHPTKTYFFPSVHTGQASEHTKYSLC